MPENLLSNYTLTELQNKIDTDVKKGISPWWAHAKHNVQTSETPYITGFYQDNLGKIKTLYGQRYFKSLRIVTDTKITRPEKKQVNILKGAFQKFQNIEILKTEFWELLPSDLKSRFENGELLLTTSENLYELKKDELKNHIEKNIKKGEYFLHYYSDYKSNRVGRTAVVMDEKLNSIIIKIKGKEYILEVKGCGTLSGGFRGTHFRTGREAITGGADHWLAIGEYEILKNLKRDNAPKIAGSVLFETDEKKQGYIVRLSPSTVRASYTENICYPDITTLENVQRIIKMRAEELINQLFSNPPRIIARAGYTENLLLWGEEEFIFTDFSDHKVYSGNVFPHNEGKLSGGYFSPKQMLRIHLRMIDETPGYDAKRDLTFYNHALTEAFLKKGIKLNLNENNGYELVAKAIWEQFMAYQVFTFKKQNHYISEGILNEYKKSLTNNGFIEDLSLKSKKEFIEKYEQAYKIIEKSLNKSRINIFENIEELNNLYKTKKDSLSKEEQNAVLYFGILIREIINPIKKCLDHELDIIQSAKICSRDQELDIAEKEIKDKIKEVNQIITSGPENIYSNFVNLASLKELFSFRFYGY